MTDLLKKIPFKKRTPIEYVVYTAIILGGILIDQLSKLLVFKHHLHHQRRRRLRHAG